MKCNFVACCSEKTEKIIDDFKLNGVTFEMREDVQHKKLCASLMQMRLKFENIISTTIKIGKKEYFYNIISVKRILI
jgi:hypothetical protein